LRHVLALLAEPSPEHLTEAMVLVRFLLRDLEPLLLNDALALAGQITRTEPGLTEEQKRAGEALRKRATRANRQRFRRSLEQ
jgi:hypothetical protein